MAIVTEVRKSESFSNEKPFAVVRYRKSVNGQSKVAVGSLNDATSYSLTYNLAFIYPELNEDGEFNAKEAYKAFKSDLPVGAEEPVNCYDIPIGEISEFKAVIIVASGRRMEVMRPACYGTYEDAKRIAQASLVRQLREKTFKPADEDEDADDEE